MMTDTQVIVAFIVIGAATGIAVFVVIVGAGLSLLASWIVRRARRACAGFIERRRTGGSSLW